MRRGWPVSTSTAEHHDLLNEPIHVTTKLTDPVGELGIASPANEHRHRGFQVSNPTTGLYPFLIARR